MAVDGCPSRGVGLLVCSNSCAAPWARRTLPRKHLEIVTQAELHAPRQILHRAVSAEVSSRELVTEVQRIVVETNAVGDVKDFPGELESTPLAKLPGFGESRIDAKDSVAAEGIALTSTTTSLALTATVKSMVAG